MIFDTCSLPSDRRAGRARRFAALRHRALEMSEDNEQLDILFLRDSALAAELAELAALEAECCSVRTTIEVGPDSIRVRVKR
jgi:hypothetical protein